MNNPSKFNENVNVVVDDDSMTELRPSANDETAHTEPSAHATDVVDAQTDALVMMVDDEPINLEVTQIYLEDAGYSRFVSTDDPTKTLELLEVERPDVLLLDLMMPGMSGFDILRELREQNILKDVPTIVLTSSHDSATKLKALELGATDFLSKPVDPSELTLRVRNTLAVKAYRDRLANYDLLTGLPNRRTFLDRLAWALQHDHQYEKSGAMLHIDIDGFKQINDALGPALGDDLLQIIAVRMSRCLRDADTLEGVEISGPQPSLSRLAGDEFAVLLPVLAHTNYAAEIAERVLDAIAKPVSLSGHDLRMTCSIGISTFPADGVNSDAIVRNSGVAMHHAKRQKVHSFQFYASELNATALHQLNLGHQLREAVESKELRLFYQPTSDAHTGAICGCEALIRWQHPQRGLLAPDVFIPLAEELGLIDEIGEWVIRTACIQSNEWRDAGLPAHPISVNVSSHQFRQQRLAMTLREILEETGADPSLLIVEITEGVLLENAENNIKILDDIRSIGIKLSMDDFGTGYSSLSYLHSFPLDELKVDRCFVEQIKEPGDKSAIIRAIIAMAHSLGLTVVAEGVETPLQLEYLQSQGCDEFQGFIVSKPVPAAEFAARFLGTSSATAGAKVVPVDDVPMIAGEAAVDQVLSVNTSGIKDVGDPSAISYQWLRNNIAIGGADESSYAPYGADVGKRISVQISYTDAQGTAKGPLTSMPTAKVLGAGAARKGTASLSDTQVGSGMTIPSFTLAVDDESVQPESTSPVILGGAGDENTSSDVSAALDFADDAPLDVPAITGTATEGLAPVADTIRNGENNDVNPLQSSSLDIPGAALDDNTSSDITAVLDFADDAPLDVPDITDPATESPAPVANTLSISDNSNANPLQSNRPDIPGDALDENTSIDLTAALDFADDAPLGVLDITDTATENPAPVADTSSITDDISVSPLQSSGPDVLGDPVDENTSSDLTAMLDFADDAPPDAPDVTGAATESPAPLVDTLSISDDNDSDLLQRNDRGEPTSRGLTAPLSIVDDGPVELPTISGNAIEGQVLCVDTSRIRDADELGAFSFQWMRNNVVIDSATASIYSLNDTDVGARISVLVSYTDAQGTIKGPLTSMQTTEVVEIKDEPTGELRLAGTSPAG
jgi:diguanylate cyclase (GGDEF)-like protein